MGSGLVGLRMRGTLAGYFFFFTISRNWLSREVQSLPGQQGSRCQSIRNTLSGFQGGSLVRNPPRKRQGFYPWSRKIPHALEQLTLCATTTEAREATACALQ